MPELEKQQGITKRNTGFRLHPERINRKGRPIVPEKRHLENALREAAKAHGNVPFLNHIAEKAYTDRAVALAVLDKLVPDNQMPKETDESNGIKQIIIIRPERGTEEAKAIPRQVYIQPEDVSSHVEQLGDRQNNVLNIAGNAIQRTIEGQSRSDIQERIHRPEELDSEGLREVHREKSQQ